MNRSVNRDKDFRLSKASKTLLALSYYTGADKSAVKDMMIAAEINMEIAHRQPYNEQEFFGKAERKASREPNVKEKK